MLLLMSNIKHIRQCRAEEQLHVCHSNTGTLLHTQTV